MNPTLVCKVIGAVFVVIAIWGFVTGDRVLIFHVNTAHNVVHLASGIVALACGFAGWRASVIFCMTFGAVYGLVAVLGFLGVQRMVELLHLNTADNWLHTALSILFLVTGFAALPRLTGHPPATPRSV